MSDDLFPDISAPIPPLEAARRRLALAEARLIEAEDLEDEQGPFAQPALDVAKIEARIARAALVKLEREAMGK